jgi:succinate dehydrogenase subunit D
MARSNKPIVWGPFAAGGTLTAFLTPVLVLLTLLAALGHVPEALAYESMRAFASHWLGKLALAGVIGLSLWSAAHRLRITLYDLGVRADALVAALLYAATLACTGLAIYDLLKV